MVVKQGEGYTMWFCILSPYRRFASLPQPDAFCFSLPPFPFGACPPRPSASSAFLAFPSPLFSAPFAVHCLGSTRSLSGTFCPVVALNRQEASQSSGLCPPRTQRACLSVRARGLACACVSCLCVCECAHACTPPHECWTAEVPPPSLFHPVSQVYPITE